MKNETIKEFVRAQILEGLRELPEKCSVNFKRMYAQNQDLSVPIEDVVANMPECKLDWALTQVERTRAKNG